MFHSGLLNVGFVLFCLFKVLAPTKRAEMVVTLSSVAHTRKQAGQGGDSLSIKAAGWQGCPAAHELLCFISQEKEEEVK